jgi:hypothetical protein
MIPTSSFEDLFDSKMTKLTILFHPIIQSISTKLFNLLKYDNEYVFKITIAVDAVRCLVRERPPPYHLIVGMVLLVSLKYDDAHMFACVAVRRCRHRYHPTIFIVFN